MEAIFLALFCAALIACIAADLSVLYAMIAGYVLFLTYGLLKKHSVRDLLRMTLRGMSTVKNIMIVFCMIGILTAMWRASGTIPMIICSAAGAIRPAVCRPDDRRESRVARRGDTRRRVLRRPLLSHVDERAPRLRANGDGHIREHKGDV